VANRNFIIHRYDEISRELTWQTLAVDLPGWAALVSGSFALAAEALRNSNEKHIGVCPGTSQQLRVIWPREGVLTAIDALLPPSQREPPGAYGGGLPLGGTRTPPHDRAEGGRDVIQIDIDADLDWVDDEDRNIAKVDGAAARYKVGDVAIAGVQTFWSWILIDEIDEPWIFFTQIDAREAATHGELVIAAS
jgi:hypothetical protein